LSGTQGPSDVLGQRLRLKCSKLHAEYNMQPAACTVRHARRGSQRVRLPHWRRSVDTRTSCGMY
jgi:hypothetical protein